MRPQESPEAKDEQSLDFQRKGTKMRTRLLLLAIAVLTILVVTFWLLHYGPLKTRYLQYRLSREGPGSERFQALRQLGEKVKIGMTQEEVGAILGRPDNGDCKYVWYWVIHAREGFQRGESWAEIEKKSDGGVYVFFDADGHVCYDTLSKVSRESVDMEYWLVTHKDIGN